MSFTVTAVVCFHFLIRTSSATSSDKDFHKCISVYNADFDVCSLKSLPAFVNQQCREDIEICTKTFNVSLVNMPPYSKLRTMVVNMIRRCCGNCTSLFFVNTLDSMLHLNMESISTSHLVFPVLGRYYAERMHGYYFLPLLEAPSAYYITKKPDSRMAMDRIVISTLNMWPLVVICLLMAFVTGFIVWLMETWINEQQFPRQYYKGLFEGFWWSFVSMTTVGYGDITPKSVPSRIFSVFWILIGITVCSMFTASLSSELTSAYSPPVPNIARSIVGALKHRTYDASIIATHGGLLYLTDADNHISGIWELIRKLQNDDIDGFLLDRYTYLLFLSIVHRSLEMSEVHRTESNLSLIETKDALDFMMNATIKTEKKYHGEKLSFGMMVKGEDDYHFFGHYLRDNHIELHTCIVLMLTSTRIKFNHAHDDAHNLFAVSSGVFKPSLYVSVAAFAAICLFGIIYEIGRRKFKLFSVKIENSIT